MYKAIIVEDELMTRRGLIQTIPWTEHGCEVVGEASDGTACEEKIEFTLGNAESLEEDILTIDGNKDNMNVDVTGTVIFVCDNAQVDIYKDVTITNCKKTGNVKAQLWQSVF